jgi:hypothetical protein
VYQRRSTPVLVLLARGHGRRTDGIDAASVARVAQSQPDLRRVGPEDQSAVLRLLSDRRDELTGERRRVVNRLHRLLRDQWPGGAPTELSTEAAARLLNRIRPKTAVDLERKLMARALVARPATGPTAPSSRTGLGAPRASPRAAPRSRRSSAYALDEHRRGRRRTRYRCRPRRAGRACPRRDLREGRVR